MAAACLGCGLPLNNDDDAFCGNCGRPRATAPGDSADSTTRFTVEPSAPAPGPDALGGRPGDGPPRGWSSASPPEDGEPPPGRYPADHADARRPPHAGAGDQDWGGPADAPGRARAAPPPPPPRGAGYGAEKPPPPGNVAYGPAQTPPPPADVARAADDEAARLRYTDVTGEPTFDPLRNTRFGWQLARRYALFFLLGYVIDTVITLLCFLVTLANGSYAGALLSGTVPGVLVVGAVLSLLVQIALLIIYLVLPVPALMAQWSRLLGFRAEAADVAFEHITQAMRRHNTPCDSLRTRKLAPPGEGRRNYLEMRRGVFAFYISCFAHGSDLYCGWTFWIYMNPVRWFTMKISRQIEDWTGRGNDMYQTLRYESTRAMIAAGHSCTLEGIDVAIRTLAPDGGLPGDSPEVSIS
jgi:hypothetical protein